MALVFDNRHNLQPGEPGIHALIAGVSVLKPFEPKDLEALYRHAQTPGAILLFH